MIRNEIKAILEGVACLARDAYGNYIEKMTDYIMALNEKDILKAKEDNLTKSDSKGNQMVGNPQ